MKISIPKLELQMARACKTREDLREVLSAGTLRRIRTSEDLRPATIGRIAKALGVDVTEILLEEEVSNA